MCCQLRVILPFSVTECAAAVSHYHKTFIGTEAARRLRERSRPNLLRRYSTQSSPPLFNVNRALRSITAPYDQPPSLRFAPVDPDGAVPAASFVLISTSGFSIASFPARYR